MNVFFNKEAIRFRHIDIEKKLSLKEFNKKKNVDLNST